MKPNPTIIFALVCVGYGHPAFAGGVKINVINEHNNGVYSRVYYNDGTQPPPFLNTDQKGLVPQSPLHAKRYGRCTLIRSTLVPISIR